MPHPLRPPTTLINAQPHQQPTVHIPDPLAAGKTPRLPAVRRGPVEAAVVGQPLRPVAPAAAPPSRRLCDDWSGADFGSRLERRWHQPKQ